MAKSEYELSASYHEPANKHIPWEETNPILIYKISACVRAFWPNVSATVFSDIHTSPRQMTNKEIKDSRVIFFFFSPTNQWFVYRSLLMADASKEVFLAHLLCSYYLNVYELIIQIY